jgi:hypothetical protein
MALVWLLAGRDLFYAIETQWGVWPGDYPFSDLEGLLSGIECHRKGIDPYVYNACDTWRRQFDYPPGWLLLSVFPVTTGWLVPAGIALCLAFLASLLLLPAARTDQGARLIAAGVLSSVTAFAVERANNDLVVFILVAIGAALLSRPRAGIAGYAVIYLAGMLKYFPLAAMGIALREAPRRLALVAGAAIAVTGLFIALHHEELRTALATIPFGSPFRMVYGASNLGTGLVMIGAPEGLGRAVTALLCAGALGGGIALGLRPAAAEAAGLLSPRESTFALAGAAMVLGTFFAAQNIDYRAVHMLLVLPVLVNLRDLGTARRYASLCWVGLALLWMNFFRIKVLSVAYLFEGAAQQLIEAVPGFLLREALWWWFAIHLVALATAILRSAPVPAALLGLVSSKRPLAAGS